jgi:microfibrillar-associated protein 1
LKRIKRYKVEEERLRTEFEELERRRNMTDAERREDELAAGIDRFKKDKGQQKFMQRYYHKGVFYQEDAGDLLERDYTAPTLEDNYNKELMPEVMRVRQKFGFASQSKWTHLTAEDTTEVL